MITPVLLMMIKYAAAGKMTLRIPAYTAYTHLFSVMLSDIIPYRAIKSKLIYFLFNKECFIELI